jgi:hypothetical protein
VEISVDFYMRTVKKNHLYFYVPNRRKIIINVMKVWGVTFGIRADLTGCPVVPMVSSGSLREVDCHIPHRRVRDW